MRNIFMKKAHDNVRLEEELKDFKEKNNNIAMP